MASTIVARPPSFRLAGSEGSVHAEVVPLEGQLGHSVMLPGTDAVPVSAELFRLALEGDSEAARILQNQGVKIAGRHLEWLGDDGFRPLELEDVGAARHALAQAPSMDAALDAWMHPQEGGWTKERVETAIGIPQAAASVHEALGITGRQAAELRRDLAGELEKLATHRGWESQPQVHIQPDLVGGQQVVFSLTERARPAPARPFGTQVLASVGHLPARRDLYDEGGAHPASWSVKAEERSGRYYRKVSTLAAPQTFSTFEEAKAHAASVLRGLASGR